MIWGAVVGAAVIIAVAGVAKMAKPQVAIHAMQAAGVTVPAWLVTAFGGFELALGVAVVTWQWMPAVALLAGCYSGFAVFALRILVGGGPAVSCGCFGQDDAPIGVEHVIVNLAMAAVIVAAIAGIGPRAPDPVAAVGTTALLFVLLAVVPGLRASRR